MTYEPRDSSEIRGTVVTELQSLLDDPATTDDDVIGAIIAATSKTIAQQQEQSLDELDKDAFLDTATGEALTRKARERGVQRRDAVRATGVLEFSRSTLPSTNYRIPVGTRVTTPDGSVTFETTEGRILSKPETVSDETVYTTSNTSYTRLTTLSVDTTGHDTITLSAGYRVSDSSHTAKLRFYNVTDSTTEIDFSTSETIYQSESHSVNVSDRDGQVEYAFELLVTDSNTSGDLRDATIDVAGRTTVRANARAVEGGTDGNLPEGRLTRMPSPPSGVESVRNPKPTGDPDFVDRTGDTLVPGLARESDEELRERTFASSSIGGAATPGAIETALFDIDGVTSVTIFSNGTNATNSDGLPPYSSEILVSGGSDGEIAAALRDTVAVTELLRLQSGVIGNGVTRDVYVDTLDRSVTVGFSRPLLAEMTIEIDVVTDDTFVGKETLKDRIVEYIGGTRVDGSTVTGLGVGDDIVVDRVEDTIVGEDTGVVGVTNLVLDKNDDGTDDRTTRSSDNLSVISIADDEEATVNTVDIAINEV